MTARYKVPFLVIGALFALWGLVGLLDMSDRPYGGFNNGPDYVVNQVEEGGPADAAGLKVGDRIITYNGISAEDAQAFVRMALPRIGETRIIVVERAGDTTPVAGGGEPVTLEVALTYGARPWEYVALVWAWFVVGLCFIGFGLLAYIRAPSRPAMLLAVTGLCVGVDFLSGPYIGSYTLRQVVESVTVLLPLLGLGTLIHLLMVFPKPKALLRKAYARVALYGPIALIALFTLWLNLLVSQRTGTFNTVVNAINGIFVILYFSLGLATLIHSFARATSAERSRYGLNMMLAGLLVGLLPGLIASAVSIFAPNVILPGSDWVFLTVVFIPITMALAVMKSGVASAPESAPLK